MRHQKHINILCRLAVIIRGAVQGVGFRPFVYRLATEMQVNGWISNTSVGVCIEAEGTKEILDRFLLRVQREIPPHAFIQSMEFSFLDPAGLGRFEIRESDSLGVKTAIILSDIATCPECLKEIFDPLNRRHLYPFTNCTNCGPRFSIIEALPYDRPNTSMKKFEMCSECRSEYENPLDRRFHAQPNACPQCGPQLQLWDDHGIKTAERHEALLQAVQAIRNGKIVALKGLGGFHFMVDAQNDNAVHRLRKRKHREEKPFALMFPSLKNLKRECEINEFEQRLLLSSESPIVLLRRIKALLPNQKSFISNSVAPGNPYIGAMLPYTPLHHIFMHELGIPVVATSGNLSNEPICTDEQEAFERLRGIADVYLIHNRPIVRHVDDSIVRVMMGRELVLRRARGYAPLPIAVVGTHHGVSLLAVGAHLKNTIALTLDSNVFISQHIGDLETQQSLEAFHRVITDFQTMYNCKPSYTVCDLHPEYLSSKFAHNLNNETIKVQHHYAHIASCMAENKLDGEVLGISWDGTGYGTDGTIWGGEFLLTTKDSFTRVATIRSFRLPGGEKAIKEPRRTAVGMLYELFGDELFEQQQLPLGAFTSVELDLIKQMLIKKVNAPLTTSVGRIFDAVASLIGLQHVVNYEGQAAMELEFLTIDIESEEHYKFEIKETQDMLTINWQPMIEGILKDSKNQISHSMISTKFHNTLAEMIIAIAKKIGQARVVLSGGCFQNRYLTERTVQRLQEEGFRPYWHQRVPPNDGGLALGQAYAVLRSLDINKT